MWTGVWEVPADAPLGTASDTITAKDTVGLPQLAIVE